MTQKPFCPCEGFISHTADVSGKTAIGQETMLSDSSDRRILRLRLDLAQEYRSMARRKSPRWAHWNKVVTDLERLYEYGCHDNRHRLPSLPASRHGGGSAGR